MPQIIEVPGMGQVEFPDGMSDADIVAAIKKNSNQPTTQQAQKQPTPDYAAMFKSPSIGQGLIGLGENILHAGTGMVGGLGGGLSYLGTLAATRNPEAASSVMSDTQNALTYQPRTQAGQYQADVAGKIFSAPSRFAEHVGGNAIEKGHSPLFATGMEVGLNAIPMMIGGKAAKDYSTARVAESQRPLGPREQILKDAGAEGLVAPPSITNPTVANRFMEGFAGKLKLGQEAAAMNQPQINRLMARSVGKGTEQPLMPGDLRGIRATAADSGYAPIRTAGQVSTDAKYISELDGITKSSQGAARSFPGIAKKSPIDDVVGALKQKTFDASDGIDAISYLREQADAAYSSGDKTLGKSYKSASKVIEDMIERDLSNRGESGAKLLKDFRDARTLMAKTYTAEKSLIGETGDFNARSVASDFLRDKPLTGDQRLVGNFSSAFSKYTPKPNGEAFPSISPLDVYGSAIASGAAGNPLPFLYPLSRTGMRKYLLSPKGQERAFKKAGSNGVADGFLQLNPMLLNGGMFGDQNQ